MSLDYGSVTTNNIVMVEHTLKAYLSTASSGITFFSLNLALCSFCIGNRASLNISSSAFLASSESNVDARCLQAIPRRTNPSKIFKSPRHTKRRKQSPLSTDAPVKAKWRCTIGRSVVITMHPSGNGAKPSRRITLWQ